MTSLSFTAARAADPEPASSAICGGTAGDGGARDWVGSVTPGTLGSCGCAPTRSCPWRSSSSSNRLHPLGR
eukprot:11331644-Prorocentrum_lima.AAC.1